MLELLRRGRLALEERLSARGLSHTVSLARYTLHREVGRRIERLAAGEALDVGAGRSPFAGRLERQCARVTTLDVEDRSGRVDLIADVQRMPELEGQSFDTVLCTQVLEHVPRPWRALGEMRRVLRPGGRLILTVPHLSPLHEAPHDYFRYTRHGLANLCREVGLEVEEIEAVGGLLSFLAHGASYLLLSGPGALPGLRWPAWGLNYLLLIRLLSPLDRWLGLPGVYPCNYLLVARRPPEGEGE